jgi:hypothetical protein
LFVKTITTAGYVGALCAAMGLAAIFLGSGGGGNSIGGMAVVVTMLFFAVVLVGCYALALLGSLMLLADGDRFFWRGFRWLTLALMVMAVGTVVLLSHQDRKREQERDEQEKAIEQEAAAGRVTLSDPARLEAFTTKNGLNEKIPGVGKTPLEGAIEAGYDDLAKKYVAQNARVTDGALLQAVIRQRADLLSLLISHATLSDEPAPDHVQGYEALQESYRQGAEDLLHILVERGVQVDGLVQKLVNDSDYVRFFPADIHGQALLAHCQDEAECPHAIIEALRRHPGPRGFQVADALNDVLIDHELFEDPKVHFETLKLEPWVKQTPHSGSSLIRPINWAILHERYPDAVPPPGRARWNGMFRFLARNVSKTSTDASNILRTVISGSNVDLLELLLQEGFSLEPLKDEISQISFLHVPDEQRMKAYLVKRGVRVKEEEPAFTR